MFSRGNLVTWRRKKQLVVIRSRIEAKFKATTYKISEFLWIKIILSDLGIKWKKLVKLYYDNKLSINIAHNLVQHDRTKHVSGLTF